MQTTQMTDQEPLERLRPRREDSRPTSPVVGHAAAGTAFILAGVLALRKALATDWIASWRIGAVCLVAGSAIFVWGLMSRRRRHRPGLPFSQASVPAKPRDPTMPMLGALLVYKYQIITEGQLKRAMEFQRKQGRSGRDLLLGQVLSEMGLITSSQLREALQFQQSRVRDGYWAPTLEAGDTDIVAP